MTKPLVTIGITAFNAEETIGRAIASALAQDWPNLEVVIVDDASTDATRARAERMIAGDGRARLFPHARNAGPAAARNSVLAAARGELIAFFDDDDESAPDRVREQVAALRAYEAETGADLVACYAAGVRRYRSGYVKLLPAIGVGGWEVPQGPGVADWLLFYRRNPRWDFGSGVPTSALMARAGTFAAVGGFDDSFRRIEDGDFAIRLALAGGHFIGTERALFTQYATGGADKSPERNLEAEQHLAEKHRDYLKSVGRYGYAWRWPRLRYWHFKRRYGRAALDLLLLLAVHPIAVIRHVLSTAPRRLRHERSVGAGGGP